MKKFILPSLAIALLSVGGAAAADAARVTTVLLPTKSPAEIYLSHPGGSNTACLTFDLSAVPKKANKLGVELRLVGTETGHGRPQLVNVYKGDGTCKVANKKGTTTPSGSLSSWRVPEKSDRHPDHARVMTSVEEEDEGGLATTVREALGGQLELLLRAESHDSDWTYASLETPHELVGGTPDTHKAGSREHRSSTLPRLILTYEPPAGASATSTAALQARPAATST